MSSVYNSEPPTNGKLVFHTTHGDIEIELWTKEAPKVTKSFLQLAIDGFYDGCTFHRVIKGLFAQAGGPPHDNSSEGPDLYNGSVNFLSEQHSRLRFGHRGQVAMAGKKGSQFFMTLGKADWLNGQHCIIGKVTGDSIFNLVRLGEVDTDGHDVPTDDPPPTITRVEVLHAGPWEGMQARVGSKRQVEAEQAAAAAARAHAPGRAQGSGGRGAGGGQVVGKMSKAVLSFAGGEEEEEQGVGMIGSGRAVFAGAVSGTAPLTAARQADPSPPPPQQAQARQEQGSHTVRQEQGRAQRDAVPTQTKAPTPAPPPPSISEAEELMAQIKASRHAVATSRTTTTSSSSSSSASTGDTAQQGAGQGSEGSVLKSMRAKYLSKKRAGGGGDRESSTLARLAAFQSTLKSTLSTTAPVHEGEGAQVYHGQVLEEEEGGMEGSGDAASLSWAATAGLHFKKHIDDAYRAGQGGGGGGEDGLVTMDPLQGRRHVPAKPAPAVRPALPSTTEAAPPASTSGGMDAASLAARIMGQVMSQAEEDRGPHGRYGREHSRSRSRDRHRDRERGGRDRDRGGYREERGRDSRR